MACCTRPDIKSSTFSDWCENCGYEYNYLSNEQTGDSNRVRSESEDEEDDDYRY